MTVDDNHHTPTLTLETVFKLLAVPVRRHLLSYLQNMEQSVASLDELLEYINSETESAKTPQQIRIVLVHTHLPKLAEYGVIEYDERTEMVRYHSGQYFESAIAFAADHERDQ